MHQVSALTDRWEELFDSLPENHFCFLLSPSGHYLKLRVPDKNRLWIPLEDHIGKHLSEVLPDDLLKDRLYYLDKVLQSGKIAQYSYPHPITHWRHSTCVMTPIKNGSGAVTEVLMEVYDTALTEIPGQYKS